VKVRPGAISPESHAPVALVLVCAIGSLLVNVIAWPGLTVIVAGANANLLMLTLAASAAVAPAAAGAGADGAGAEPCGAAGVVAPPAGWPAGPLALVHGCTTILRGALPTGTVATPRRGIERPTGPTEFNDCIMSCFQNV
jgi:hypothetical protein